ncbi:MAG: glycosyltransferase family 39 protein [Phycisphaerales bacterium]|nr:glycosyltransferase family 39 protein [Phycisphaerales bacterium]MCB9854387.1 glycosyltransferase family 39 protein [Phycisphaerales bacterium]MCB9863588.1 glycosyltransferase family 39 protein [Phycisphaerales bacterium]
MTILIGVALALPVSIYAGVVIWSAARGIETLWDEAVDLQIANDFRDAPLRGGDPIDPSQLRLPMMIDAVGAELFGWTGYDGARFVSVLAAVVTILAAAALAAMLFDAWTALLAAVLLSLSPYFLAFARIGMTEGDILAACFCTIAVLAYVWYLKRPTSGRWALAGVALALAIGAKLFAVFLIVAFAFLSATTYSEPAITFKRDPRDVNRLRKWLVILWIMIVVTFLLAYANTHPPSTEGLEWAGDVAGTLATIGWVLLLLGWIGATVFAVSRGVIASARSTRFRHLMLFAGATFFVLMPVHLLQPEIIKSIVARALRWDHRIPLALWADHLRLYTGIIFIKATIPVGVVTGLAILQAMTSERSEGRWRPCLFVVLFYIPLLCFLPLRQTFYLMPIYPALMILTSAFAVGTVRYCFSLGPGYGIFAVALVAVGLGNLAMESRAIHPDYHVFGYQTVGDRWLGAESRGYRNLIQTPSDGVVSLINWCNTSGQVHEGDQVVSYLWEDRIIGQCLDPDRPFRFTSRGVTEASDVVPELPSFVSADFVLLHINNLLGYGDRAPDHPDMALLEQHFEKAFTVVRGSAARPLEVAWVYRRKR